MKLIVHIGTAKTGTTALQQFFHANRKTLAERGFHYATPPRGVGHSNLLAQALNAERTVAVRAFLTTHSDLARRRGAHTILASAENFYAMSVLSAMQRRQVCTDALDRDEALIEAFHSLIPDAITSVQIVCYFRRPDRYAESLYSQHVKRGILFEGTFDEFLPIIDPALLYNQYVGIWSSTFGSRSCVIRSYDSAGTDIVGDFLQKIMKLTDVAAFVNVKKKANERIGRDLLEFKRLMNSSVRFSERHMERTILGLIDEEMELRRTEPDFYQEFLAPDERAELLRRLRPEMDALRASYGVSPFPPFDLASAKAKWNPYPGLGRERRQEIESHYNRISRSVPFRLERLALRSASFLRRSLPVTGVLLDALKEMGAKRALHGWVTRLQGWSGLQRRSR